MPWDPYGNIDDETLLSLAQQSGYIPEPAQGMGLSNEGPQLTPPEPLVSPETVPAPAPLQPGQGRSMGMGASYGGYSEAQNQKVSRGDAALNAQLNQAGAQAQAAGAPLLQSAELSRTTAQRAELEKTQANSEMITAGGVQAGLMGKLQDDFAAEEAQINAESTALSNQSKADYLSSLMDFRASKVDPAQLWSNMTGGERFGTLATAFVHDFLGARGIHTSAMDTFNKAIDRNIESQIQGIKVKGEVAEGFKSLWYMQRNQSASDAEARVRVRGFLLEGAKQAVVANMAQYESALASAQGQAAIAKIDEEFSKNLIEIYKHVDANTLALRNQAIDRWKAKLHASMEQQSLNLRAQEMEQRERLAKASQPQTNPMSKYIPDTSASGGGRIKYEFHAGSPAKQDEIRERLGALSAYDNQAAQLQDLMRNTSVITDKRITSFLQSPEGARLIAARDNLVMQQVIADSGKAFTKEEVAARTALYPIETWLTRGDRSKIIADTIESQRDITFGRMAPFVREIGKDELAPDGVTKLRDIEMSPHFNAPGEVPTGVPNEAAATANFLVQNPVPPDSTELRRHEGLALIQGPDTNEPYSSLDGKIPSYAEKAHKEFVKAYPQFEDKGEESYDVTGKKIHAQPKNTVHNYEVGLSKLKSSAEDGDEVAYRQLIKEATPYLNGSYATGINGQTEPDAQSVFATFLLYQLAKENPDKFKSPQQD